MLDVNWTYCGAHFVVYTNFESLHCTPDINSMLCQLLPNKNKTHVYILESWLTSLTGLKLAMVIHDISPMWCLYQLVLKLRLVLLFLTLHSVKLA